MKLYKVSANRAIGYDEYVAFVVKALDEDQAVKIATDAGLMPDCTAEELIDDNRSGVVLGSFNAG